MSSAASAEVHVADVPITATGRHGSISSERPGCIGAGMAERNIDDKGAGSNSSSGSRKDSAASSLASASPRLALKSSHAQAIYSQPMRRTGASISTLGSAPTHLAFPNLDFPSIPSSAVRHQPSGSAACAATRAAQSVMGDGNLEIRAGPIPYANPTDTATGTTTVIGTGGTGNAERRMHIQGSPQTGELPYNIYVPQATPEAARQTQPHGFATTASNTAATTRTATPSANPSSAAATATEATPNAPSDTTAHLSDSRRWVPTQASMPDARESFRLRSAPIDSAGSVDAPTYALASAVSISPSSSSLFVRTASIDTQAGALCQHQTSNVEGTAMDTSSEADSQDPRLPVSATSTEGFEGGIPLGQPLGHHARTLSESHIAPIRSLTGLALSPGSTRAQHRQSLSMRSEAGQSWQGGVGAHLGALDASMYQEMLTRMDGINRHCEHLVQMQTQQAEQIRSLEATIRQYSEAARSAMGGPMAMPFISTGPPHSSAQQAQTQARRQGFQSPPPHMPLADAGSAVLTGSGLAGVSGSGSGRELTQPQHQSHYSLGGREAAADEVERITTNAEGVVYQSQSDSYPGEGHRQQRFHHHYGRAQQQQQHYPQSASRLSPSHVYRNPGHFHQSRATPYSTRASPTARAAQSPPRVASVALRGMHSTHSMAQMTAYETPSGRRRRDTLYSQTRAAGTHPLWSSQHHFSAQPGLESGAGSSAAFASAVGATDERPVHVQSQYAGVGSSTQPPRLAVPHGPAAVSAFGSATPAASSVVEQYSAAAGGHLVPRSRRPTAGEMSDESGAGRAAVGGPHQAPPYGHVQPQYPRQQQQHYYHPQQHPQQHQIHTLLPPIRAAGIVRGGGAEARRYATPARGGPGGVQLAHPETALVGRSARPSKDKGKAGLDAGAGDAPAGSSGGNPDAQPTQAWLSGQRHYKNALLHLLTLESFYPSDIAMLNMFRTQGDFTNEQIEANGAAMLSWARSWLRYNRNAVLRGTLDNKAKATLPQLAEALQHDLHAETAFTTPHNIRRCALLRLIYYQWQAENKLGTKSQSLYRDYETRLREIEALPTAQEQEAEWNAILGEEQNRRLALIRENRGSGGATILPRHDAAQAGSTASPARQAPRTQAIQASPGRRASLEWPAQQSASGTPAPGQAHYHQHAMQQQLRGPLGQHGLQESVHAFHTQSQRLTRDPGEGWTPGSQAAVGRDDDSEMSVNLSPEPR
ncbi:hypothetical protein H4R20_000121 [Coemansia guatemalensis]|uniref:Uncharacterized protein n=1 Tax=Coemansia guatemalensis TaxID=2761395 RepID=A0A9W8LX73_9FUNG|nr:hypothetical protein H4R20_000121 [Coemansia guatemalensis]